MNHVNCTLSGRGVFSLAALTTATLLSARSLRGALASHSSMVSCGLGRGVDVAGMPARRWGAGAFDITLVLTRT